MRALLVAVVSPVLTLALALATESAEASSCMLGPFSLVANPPLGCDVILVDIPSGYAAAPEVMAQRGSETVDVTGTVTTTTRPVDVHFANYACDGSILTQYTTTEDATVHRITLQGAEAGDTLYVGGIHSGVVQASGTCTEDFSQLSPYCTGRNSGYPCDEDTKDDDETKDDDAVGCNAGRGSAGLAILVLSIFMTRRRSR